MTEYRYRLDVPHYFRVRFADGTDERVAAPTAADAVESVRARHPVGCSPAYEAPSIADMQDIEGVRQ